MKIDYSCFSWGELERRSVHDPAAAAELVSRQTRNVLASRCTRRSSASTQAAHAAFDKDRMMVVPLNKDPEEAVRNMEPDEAYRWFKYSSSKHRRTVLNDPNKVREEILKIYPNMDEWKMIPLRHR